MKSPESHQETDEEFAKRLRDEALTLLEKDKKQGIPTPPAETDEQFAKRIKEEGVPDFITNPEIAVAKNEKVEKVHSELSDAEHKIVLVSTFTPFVQEYNPNLAQQLERKKEKLEPVVSGGERNFEIARLKAEIDELNKVVQKSEAMSRFGHEHGFNKDETYAFIERRIKENEDRIHELEGGRKEKEENVPIPEPIPVPPKPEPVPTPLPPEVPSRVREILEKDKEKKNWWGWVKERVKGLATFGFWEFHQAERFRSNKSEVSKQIKESADRIRKTENLSLEDALVEAKIMQMIAEGRGLNNPENKDYQKFSEIITGHKVEENNKRIEIIVANSTKELKDRLTKYRDEFGKVIIKDPAVIAKFQEGLRESLLRLQNGRVESDTKRFNEIITNRLDPNYWRRYVYGALEMALMALGFNVVVGKIATSKWWLGKKVADIAPDIGGTPPNFINLPPEYVPDELAMKDTIWRSAREWLQGNGVPNPTNQEIMNVSKQVATDNGIGVKIWDIPGQPLDTNMQQGFLLKFGGASKILTAIKIARGIASVI